MLKENTSERIYPHFTLSYFIFTSTEVTFPFSSPLQILQGENGMLSVYLWELQWGQCIYHSHRSVCVCVCFEDVSEVIS